MADLLLAFMLESPYAQPWFAPARDAKPVPALLPASRLLVGCVLLLVACAFLRSGERPERHLQTRDPRLSGYQRKAISSSI